MGIAEHGEKSLDGLFHEEGSHLSLQNIKDCVEELEHFLADFVVVDVDRKEPESCLNVLSGNVMAELLCLGDLIQHVVHEVANELQGEDDGRLDLLLESLVTHKVDLSLDGPETMETLIRIKSGKDDNLRSQLNH